MSVGKKEKINVLSLFDGMSCGQIALERAGIKVNKYYASEIDKHAIKVTQHNYPNTIQLGSVTEVNVKDLEPIDLLIGGSPCQSFSFAGKRNGMTTSCNEEIYTLERYLELKADGFQFEGESYLFWEYMRILTDIRKYNPDVLFLLENVEMGAKWERVLSEAIGIYGVHINSALVSAQNRKRIYWTNIRVRDEGLFGELHSDIPQPKDKGILLRDILETDVPDKYYLSEKMLQYFSNRAANFNNGKVNIRDMDEKATTITSSYKSADISDNFVMGTNMKPRENQNKASCFTAGGNSGGLHSDMDLICISSTQKNATVTTNKSSPMTAAMGMGGGHVPMIAAMPGCEAVLTPKRTEYGKAIRKDYEAGKIQEQRKNIQQLEPRKDGKTNNPHECSKDNLVMQLNQSTESNGVQPYQQNRVYDINGISPALMAQMSCGSHAIMIPEATKKGFIEVKPGECFDFENPKSETRRGRKMTDKSNNLMASTTNFMKYEGIEIRENYAVTGDGYEQDNRVYYENGKSGALDTKSKTRQKVLLNYEHSLTPDQLAKFNPDVDTSKHNALTQAIGRGGSSSEYMDSVSKVSKLSLRIRRLTPVECERLQTVPDNYTSCVNDTQRYKMLGNGWTVEVIKHIFSFLNGFEKTNVGGQKNKLRSNSTNVHSKNECSTCG